jgi:hypothetical protein
MSDDGFRSTRWPACKSILDSFKAANPSMLRETFPVQPPGSLIAADAVRRSSTCGDEADHPRLRHPRRGCMSPAIVVVDRLDRERRDVMARIEQPRRRDASTTSRLTPTSRPASSTTGG